MSAPTSVQARVEQFLVERRQLGFSDDGYVLRSFARHVHATGHRGALTVELMTVWARSDRNGCNDPRTWARRLKKLRTFLRWLQQFEPRTEVPDDSIFGRLPERQAPHIFSEEEIVDLLACARRLGPAPGLRGAVYETLFGLIAATGLRIGEALSLRNGDIDLKDGMLTIRRTKFGKSRQVPMHPSTWMPCAGIAGYVTWPRGRRRRIAHSSSAPAVDDEVCHLATVRCTASSATCASNWAGATAVHTMPHASMTCGTPSSCAASCSGKPKAWTSIRPCCRCRPTSGIRW